MRTPSPPQCGLDLVPPLADRFIFGVAPIDYGPVLLRMPFGFHLTMDTLPSGVTASRGCRSALAVSDFRLRARLGFSIPRALSGQRGFTPAFGYDTPHPSARGTSTLLNNALLSAHYGPLRLPAGPPRSYAFPRSVGRFRARPNRASQAPRLICPRALSPTTPEGPMTAYACCFATGLVWLHPSRADWPPSYSYRGRIGFTLRYGSRVRLASPPAPSLEPALARLRAEQAIYTMNSFQFIRSTRLILAYPTNGRRTISFMLFVLA